MLVFYVNIVGNPRHVIIPILVTITVFPLLVTLAICLVRIRNIRAREKRIIDWVTENKTKPGTYK